MKLLLAYDIGFSPEHIRQIADCGFEITRLDGETDLEGHDPAQFEAVICYQFFNHFDISRFTALKLIHTTSAGLDHMPMDYIRRHGIRLFNASGVYSAPMAEEALCGVLQLYKRAAFFRENQRTHVWEQTRLLRELDGKRVCIAGAGSIGEENAKRFSAMGCRITGLCRRPAPKEHFDRVLPISELDAVLPESDIVILSLPLADDTRHMINAARFEKMKEGAVLVNIARGPIVDTPALIMALTSGRLSGAVLDVFEGEPLPPESPLWDMENVIITPHNSFHGEGNPERMCRLMCRDFEIYQNELKQNITE